MKKYLIILGALVTVLFVSNQGVVFIEGLMIHYHFQTENKEFETVLISNKHKDETVLVKFNRFKAENPEMDHLILYRTFEKNYLKFWNWQTYLERDIYKYPYLEKEDVISKMKPINENGSFFADTIPERTNPKTLDFTKNQLFIDTTRNSRFYTKLKAWEASDEVCRNLAWEGVIDFATVEEKVNLAATQIAIRTAGLDCD